MRQGKEVSSVSAPDTSFDTSFIETLEYRRFSEFCDACRKYRYIGLCYGPPGVGKTLSARRYARWDALGGEARIRGGLTSASTIAPELLADPCATLATALYTTPVINTPRLVVQEVERLRKWLHTLAREPLRREEETVLEQIRERNSKHQDEYLLSGEWLFKPITPLKPTYADVAQEYSRRSNAVPDPTNLILVDEADRLKMASLEQMRSLFDAGDIALVLIGMPGIEKRLARYAQFYSRIGFVHEFRTLSTSELRRLLAQGWTPPGVNLPLPLDEETIAAVVRITGGNFRLVNRLLTQAERILQINSLDQVSRAVLEAARESLVIGEQ
jgi:DNA transposition AAA+ family ATPase